MRLNTALVHFNKQLIAAPACVGVIGQTPDTLPPDGELIIIGLVCRSIWPDIKKRPLTDEEEQGYVKKPGRAPLKIPNYQQFHRELSRFMLLFCSHISS